MSNLSELKDLIFKTDNKACFIERERILGELEAEMKDYKGEDKYARIFSILLSKVSTPILDCDYFAGRVVEALPDENISAPNFLLCATGHMSFDYEKVLKVGLKGILEEIKEVANKNGDSESISFAKNAEIVVNAVKEYTYRYAKSAEEMGKKEMADALAVVPYLPAFDFYSALQSVWLIHMIASCYVGERDYAFGRFDKCMYPFYKKALENGQTREELTEILAGFMIKTNEICGRTTWNYASKPILCQASKQYINIGGEDVNEFSSVVLDAAQLNNMAQPQITVLLKPEYDENFTSDVFSALSVLTDKMNIYNYDSIVKVLIKKGIEEDVAKDFTYSACCTFDLNYHTYRKEYFTPVPQIFLNTIKAKEYKNLEELVNSFKDSLYEDINAFAQLKQNAFDINYFRKAFVFDCLLLSDSAKKCCFPSYFDTPYNVLNIFCPGIATIGDSLFVLDKLVFKEKRYTYKQFMDILDKNFDGFEELRKEILSLTMFGNDSENDSYTKLAADTFLDTINDIPLRNNFYIAPGFYSLERDNSWKNEVGATPNGRKAGEPFSENQSPTYGADKSGITALLNSLAKLPLDKTVTGGLNLTFAQKVEPAILKALVVSYFKNGGYHVGISVIDKETLKDAMVNPDKYKSLTVRLYGFSEYFVSLPKWQQLAVLNRTEYN